MEELTNADIGDVFFMSNLIGYYLINADHYLAACTARAVVLEHRDDVRHFVRTPAKMRHRAVYW